jgi:sensor c-di-GMP phosphodiesterase-like protein
LIEERARATIESLIQFAQIRGWKLIAESVETQEQANWYMNQTDALFQGMLFSKVIFPNEFADTYLNKVR